MKPWLLKGACGLAFGVVLMGATVRLADAGLSCPDWPGCFGKMIAFGSSHKAWLEMIHRYIAGLLGILVLVTVIISWAVHRQRILTSLLLALIIFQAALGMWTVTLLLHPLVVMGHLMGGLATLGLLWWMVLSSVLPPPSPPYKRGESGVIPLLALIILILQIALGGWVSANYAFYSCPDFPTCQGSWWPQLNVAAAFWPGKLGVNYEFGLLDMSGRVTIQWIHQMGAYLTVIVLTAIAVSSIRRNGSARFFGVALLVLVFSQFALGVANAVLARPLIAAVAHNGLAALLLMAVIGLIRSGEVKRNGVVI